MKKRVVALVGAFALIIGIAGVALGDQQERSARTSVKSFRDTGVDVAGEADPDEDQHGSADGHLPPKRRNVSLISRLKLTDTEGGIADVHYYKGYAYLAAWAPECPTSATDTSRGGVHIVDVRNPRNPKKVGFLSAGADDYVGEGLHAIRIKNRAFTGDVLLANHEGCGANFQEGISLYDVTNPRRPWPLASHVGDNNTGDDDPATPEDEREYFPTPNSVHSVLGWTANKGRKAYAVMVDNYEQGFNDVDIMDISNPGRPRLISEVSLRDWPEAEVDGNGSNNFHHDVWHRVIDGHHVLGVSYWDAGWVFLNVDDPSNPVFLNDTNYPEKTLRSPTIAEDFTPEGNAHQGVWSKNTKWWIGTDEDFAPFRSEFEILTGANQGVYEGGEFGWTIPIAQNFEEDKAEGTTVWGGTGCPEDVNGNGTSDRAEVPDAADYDAQYSEGEERILVLTRGVCFFSEKVESGEMHGWDMVIVGNHHSGSGGGSFPDAFLCGGQGHAYDPTVSGGCTGHRAMHLIFNDTPDYTSGAYNGADLPAIGTVGDDVRMTSQFDGWGYVNLYRYPSLGYVDSYADPNTLNRNKAFGSGTMSVHEVESDPRRGRNLAYVAWYSVGLKILKFGSAGLKPMGVYRHAAGNDFWGVSLQKRRARRPLIYMSDRDSGLWIFKYTGPQ